MAGVVEGRVRLGERRGVVKKGRSEGQLAGVLGLLGLLGLPMGLLGWLGLDLEGLGARGGMTSLCGGGGVGGGLT